MDHHYTKSSYNVFESLDFKKSNDSAERVIEELKIHSFLIVKLSEEDQKTLEVSTRACLEFFSLASNDKSQFETKERKMGGSRSWELGYHNAVFREHFVCFAGNQIDDSKHPWPSDQFKTEFLIAAQVYHKICNQLFNIVHPTLTIHPDRKIAIMETFYYPNKKESFSILPNCPPHVDPGYFSIEVCPTTPGLEVFDFAKQEWICIDNLCSPGIDVIIMTGSKTEDRYKGQILATRHRVVKKSEPRLSLLYELISIDG